MEQNRFLVKRIIEKNKKSFLAYVGCLGMVGALLVETQSQNGQPQLRLSLNNKISINL